MKSRITIAALVTAAALGGTGAGFAIAGGSSTAASGDGPSSSSAKPSPEYGAPQVAGLARILGVSTDRATQVLRQLDALSRGQGVDPDSAGFRRLAAGLDRTAAQLADQLKQWKLSQAQVASASCGSTKG